MNHQPVLTPVREVHRFDEAALSAYLANLLGSEFSAISIEQFEGGQSNPTFLVTTRDRAVVLRKQPPGKLLPSAHAVDREFRVMRALADSAVPVPQTILLCEDPDIIGTPFFLMEHVAGRVVNDPRLPGFSAPERKALYDDFCAVLVRLHEVDPNAAGLGDYGSSGNYYARQIARWSKQYLASRTDQIDAMARLMAWLPENIPAAQESGLVHGDYRIGNCMIHPTEPRIVALLDWELSTLGHPLSDVGYAFLAYYYLPGMGDAPFPPPGTGIPSIEDLLRRYSQMSGRDPLPNWTFYVAFNMFRLAAIIQGVVKRGLGGNASSARWLELAKECRQMAERAWRLIQPGQALS